MWEVHIQSFSGEVNDRTTFADKAEAVKYALYMHNKLPKRWNISCKKIK